MTPRRGLTPLRASHQGEGKRERTKQGKSGDTDVNCAWGGTQRHHPCLAVYYKAGGGRKQYPKRVKTRGIPKRGVKWGRNPSPDAEEAARVPGLSLPGSRRHRALPGPGGGGLRGRCRGLRARARGLAAAAGGRDAGRHGAGGPGGTARREAGRVRDERLRLARLHGQGAARRPAWPPWSRGTSWSAARPYSPPTRYAGRTQGRG